jgi:chromosome segregation ATPase
MMKLKAPPLSPGQRDALERTAKLLSNLVTDLETRKASLNELDSALREAQSRKQQFEKDAARSSDAALSLAGAEAQLSRLAPQVEQARVSLEKQTESAIRWANSVRGKEVRELLYGHLIEQLNTSVAAAISPFFDADWARHYARVIMQHSKPWGQIMSYLNPPSIVTTEPDAAKREINALVGEIEKILAGETLLEA